MKIRLDLISFYQCFECCQSEFDLLHNIQDSEEGNDCVIKTMLKLLFLEMA